MPAAINEVIVLEQAGPIGSSIAAQLMRCCLKHYNTDPECKAAADNYVRCKEQETATKEKEEPT